MSIRKGKVFMYGQLAGEIQETDEGQYIFTYDTNYLVDEKLAYPISLTLPLRKEPYVSLTMFPFFDGLIPEGWLLNLTAKNWKISRQDRMGLLLEACRDCIGAVSIERI